MIKLDRIAIAIFSGLVVAAIICICSGFFAPKPMIFDAIPVVKKIEPHIPDFSEYPPDASTVSEAK